MAVSMAQSRISMKVGVSSTSSFAQGKSVSANVSAVTKATRSVSLAVTSQAETAERHRLNNLSPEDGSRPKRNRKGRGHAAGQGATCGFGNRGQKSRSGSGTRPGFEGGQMPLYRRMPKLKGIAGGMGAGLPKYVTVNLSDLDVFEAGEEVSLETLAAKRVINVSGRESTLPLKVLGQGELKAGVKISAAKFSDSAKEKIEAAGGSINVVPVKAKWMRAPKEAAVASE